jgi:hypothetical protein
MAFVFFAYFAVVSIVAGILTVALKNPVQCGLALLALLLHVSGLFVMLNAEFLWAVQVIVYAGAILVLYLFVLMLLNLKTDDRYFHAKAPISSRASGHRLGLSPVLVGAIPVRRLQGRCLTGGDLAERRRSCHRHQDVQRLSAAI